MIIYLIKQGINIKMYSNLKKQKDILVEDDTRSSRAAFLVQAVITKADDDSRYGKSDPRDNLTARLAQNFNAIVELLKERKELLLRKVQRMYEENADRVQAISRGRMIDIKNQAKYLRDDLISSLVDNSERMNNTKMLLRRIIEQHNFNQFQAMQKAKGKKFFDRCREVENELSAKTKKFNQMMEQLERLSQRQRQMYVKIEDRKSDMSAILRRRQHDYLRKAENIENEIQKYNIIIRDNRVTRDKKKKEAEIVLENIMETIDSHQNYTVGRISDIEELFGGSQDPQEFQKFIRQFQALIDRRMDEKKEDKKEAAIQQLRKIANGYDAYLQQIQKDRQKEVQLTEDISEGLRNCIKTALLQKLFFQQISNDKTRLAQIMKKCRSYKDLLDNFDGEKARLMKELNRLSYMKNSFGPRWKSLASQEVRKEQLRKELKEIQNKQNELERMEKRCKEHEYANSNYALTRQILEKQMNDLADRGNFGEYKARLKQLERIEKEYRNQSESVFFNQYERLRVDLEEEVRILNTRYADLIADMMVEGEPLSSMHFISKLALRLDII